MSDKNLILVIMVAFIALSVYDLATLYISYDTWEAVAEFCVLIASSLTAYAVKANKIEL